ncbi:MAG: hypothetical protein RML12_04880 [Xanthomonadales bacterium]|nr:hypothetical protein [Xanthomonadales bacterium]
MRAFLLLLPLLALGGPAQAGSSRSDDPELSWSGALPAADAALHLAAVTVELDPEILRPTATRVGISPRRRAAIEAELADALRRMVASALAESGRRLVADPAGAEIRLEVRASAVRLHPVADDLATPMASYGRREASARIELLGLSPIGERLFTLSGRLSSEDHGELRPQSALHARRELLGLFGRFARLSGERLRG